MKKGIIVILFISILLVSPLVLAQEQNQSQEQAQTQEQTELQTYSGVDRFIDNIKIFFSGGDKKVMLALEIREKELNSAIINVRNGEDESAEKNLERARKRLQFVQKKVSVDTAEDVGLSTDKTINKINEEGDLSDSFETYILEEEKTGLIAELVIEVDGKEGQTLTREIVKDESGKNKVDINVEGDDVRRVIEGEVEGQVQEQTRTREVEGEIEGQVQEQTRIREIENQIDKIDDVIDIPPMTKDNEGVTPEPDVLDNDILPGPDGIIGYEEPKKVDED